MTHGLEEFSIRAGEGTEFAATLTCLPMDDDRADYVEWRGYVKFDDNKFNWPLSLPAYNENASPIVMYNDWIYPRNQSSGALMMNMLMRWHQDIVNLIQSIRKDEAERIKG